MPISSSQIDIRTESGSFDLMQDVENQFYITRQIHDLNDFETRNADYSKTIDIPPTPNNIRIMDTYLGDSPSQGNVIECSIWMGGIPIAPKAKLLFEGSTLNNNERNYSVTILFGNFNLFDDILEGNINDMSWSDLAYDHIPSVYTAQSLNSEGLCTALADWLNRTSRRIHYPQWDIDINAAGFFIYAKEIIKRIVEEAGYTLTIAPSVPQRFNEIALACPVNKFYELGDPDQVAISAEVRNSVSQGVSSAIVRGIFDINFTGSTLWNPTLNQWEIEEAGDLNVQLTGFYSHTEDGVRPPSFIRIMKNGVALDTLAVNTDQSNTPFLIAAATTVLPSDIIYVELESQVIQTLITLEADAKFTVTTPGNSADRLIQPALYIPEIGKSEFITNMLKIFNLVLQTNDVSNEVTISSFNEVYTAEEQDLSNFLDVGFNDIESRYSISSLAQNSIFKWENDNLRRTDTEYQLRIPSQTLAKEKVVIGSIFSACDLSLNLVIGGEENLFAKIGAVGLDYESVGDLTMAVQADGSYSISAEGANLQVGMWVDLEWGGSQFTYRVTQVDTPQLGFLQTPIDAVHQSQNATLVNKVTGSDTSGTPRLALLLDIQGTTGSWDAVDGSRLNSSDFDQFSRTAYWPDELLWDNIVSTYYSEIIGALSTPRVQRAWFNIPIALFATLDFLRPIYIAEFNAFYYINKIEQYKVNQKVRLELVRISELQ